METLLGIDVGTTSTKGVLFRRDGAELARAVSAPYPTTSPRPGWVEQDPEQLWEAVLGTIQQLLNQISSADAPRAVCMAVQSGSLLPIAADGEPLAPLITWLDGRSAPTVARWQAAGHDKRVKTRSGWGLRTGQCLPTIAWLRENEPERYAEAHFCSLNDFLVWRLTGKRVTNPSNAGGMQLVNIETGEWDSELCNLAGIAPASLSELAPSGAVIGRFSAAVCRATGLPADAQLINGAHDQVATAVGLGVTEPGRLLLACGTAWVFTGVGTAVQTTAMPALDWNFHAVPDRWTISQSLGGLGRSLEWWLGEAWRGVGQTAERHTQLQALDAELVQTKPNDGLFFLPLTGGHREPATTEKGGFVGLQLGHSRAQMARAVMESAGYELHWALQGVRAAGLPVAQLWMVGGAAQSPLWPQILADITGLPIQLPQYDVWPALGAAILAGVGSGLYASAGEGQRLFGKTAVSITPNPEMYAFYQAQFQHYQQIRSRHLV